MLCSHDALDDEREANPLKFSTWIFKLAHSVHKYTTEEIKFEITKKAIEM
jgi:hypothetical protein